MALSIDKVCLPAASPASDVLAEHATTCVCGAALESVKAEVMQALPVYLPEPGQASGSVTMSTAAARGSEVTVGADNAISCVNNCGNEVAFRALMKLLNAPERLFVCQWVQRFKVEQAAASAAQPRAASGIAEPARNDAPILPSMELRVSVREGRAGKASGLRPAWRHPSQRLMILVPLSDSVLACRRLGAAELQRTHRP